MIAEPSVCPECSAKEQELIQEKLLQYEKANIYVEIAPEEKDVKAEDDFQVATRKKKKAFTNNPAPTSARANRYALRSANSSAPKKEKVEGVKSTDSIHNLKLMIYQVTDIPPFQQTLSYNGLPLERDDFTLAQYRIFPDSVLNLEKSKENDQLLEGELLICRIILADVPANYYEEGFKGTGLYGGGPPSQTPKETAMEQESLGKPCPACTLINPLSATQCSVCESKL